MVISLELQGKRHQPFSMTQPFEIKKAPEKSSGAFFMAFLERFHVEKALPTAGSRRSLEGHKHNSFALFNAGSSVF